MTGYTVFVIIIFILRGIINTRLIKLIHLMRIISLFFNGFPANPRARFGGQQFSLVHEFEQIGGVEKRTNLY